MADETNEISILEHFSELKDPRQAGKVVYPLDEMLLATFAAVIGGAEGWVDVSDFGQDKLELLRLYPHYENGVPVHDSFNDLFAKLNPGKFKKCFARGKPSFSRTQYIRHTEQGPLAAGVRRMRKSL